MGRNKDPFWQYVDNLEGNKLKCKFCGHQFAGGASRIKGHLSGIKRKGIHPCSNVPEKVQIAAASTFDDSNKRLMSNTRSSHLEENLMNLDSPMVTSRGHTKGYALPTTELVGEQFQDYANQIWQWLMKDELSVIGVWGMGGVGKTKLLKHIQNKLLEENDVDNFDYVIWVTVTQDYSISQLREVIAKSIELDISDEHEEKRIIGKLLEKFKDMNKCVLILDDVWDPIDLENVGFPISNDRYKLILTTRSLDVCQIMNCEENIIRVEILELGEDWDLFQNTLGENVTITSEVKNIAPILVHYCHGLPLAVVTIARSMKGKKEVWEWKHMLKSLENSESDDLAKWVFPVLRSSYDHLKNKKSQECFLYCALVSTSDLTSSFVMEGLIDGMLSLEAQENECHSILNKLINNSMLKVKGKRAEVHHLIRGMAINIVKETHMVSADNILAEIPDECEWTEKLEKVFLTNTHLKNFPDGLSPRCPILSTLLLHKNFKPQFTIPNDFFVNITSLRVLNLLDTYIARLPESVSNLECLVALWLCGCKSLNYVPSLAKLRKLRWLNLCGTAMAKLPQGLEMLINLRLLDLRATLMSSEIASISVIAKLTNLQTLHLNCKPGLMDVKAQYLRDFKKLEGISANFRDITEFNSYVISLTNRGLQSYYLSLGTGTKAFYEKYDEENDETDKILDKVVEFADVELRYTAPLLPKDVTRVKIEKCHQWGKCLCDVINFCENNGPCEIKSCIIVLCDELEYLFCMTCSFCHCLQLVGSLKLVDLKGLRALGINDGMVAPASSLPSTTPFSHLTDLHIIRCSGIKKLLTPKLSIQLQNLKSITVEECESLKEIFSARSEEEEDEEPVDGSNHFHYTITLPRLESVFLSDLPELHFLYKGTMDCHSLSSLDIIRCNKLKSLPEFQPVLQIREIQNGGWFARNLNIYRSSMSVR